MTTTLRIRPFAPRDAGDWGRIYHAAVHSVGAQFYSPAQCAAWSPDVPPVDRVLAHVEGLQVWVCVDAADRAQGFIELAPDGHIDCFYLAPDYAGRGAGTALYTQLEAAARAASISRLYVEASEPARRFFLRQGFTEDTRRDFDLRGVAMYNFAMKKNVSKDVSKKLCAGPAG